MKVSNVWVITDRASSISELVSGAARLGEHMTLVYAGAKELAAGAEKAYWLGEMRDNTFINFIPAVTELVKSAAPEIVLTTCSSNGRLLASHLAAALRCAVFTDVGELNVVNGVVQSKRMVYGGAAFKTETSNSKTTVVVVPDGLFETTESEMTAKVENLAAGAHVDFVEKIVSEQKASNLPAAKRVIAVGRGVQSEETLAVVQQLADALGCEVGCTRPLAEDTKLMPKETYIGISGLVLKPDVYIGVGISGQIQHTVGINTAKTIIAINKDSGAPIFTQCDYGIVANLEDVVPALIEKFK